MASPENIVAKARRAAAFREGDNPQAIDLTAAYAKYR
jgi:hypothetical protein